ncbi:hypothetical protein [Anaerovirgula multivorans]
MATDGCFYGDTKFMTGLSSNSEDLVVPFVMEVFNMLKKEGKINSFIMENMMNWQHSGFNIYCGQAVSMPQNEGTYPPESQISLLTKNHDPPNFDWFIFFPLSIAQAGNQLYLLFYYKKGAEVNSRFIEFTLANSKNRNLNFHFSFYINETSPCHIRTLVIF